MDQWPTTVYGLRLKGDLEVRYVGITQKAPEVRRAQHLYSSRRLSGTPFGRWMSDNRQSVEVFRIAETLNREHAKGIEKVAIALCEAIGHRVFNLAHAQSHTVGG